MERSSGIRLMDLPGVPRAATTVHRGPLSSVEDGYQALMRWAEGTRERIEGYGRELYLDCDGEPTTWVTELQFGLLCSAEPRDAGNGGT
jgi:effector-binding domain-containing protein